MISPSRTTLPTNPTSSCRRKTASARLTSPSTRTKSSLAIVEADYPDQTQSNAPEDDASRAIASNLIDFWKHEVDKGRMSRNLLPIQSGIGNIANAVVGGLSKGSTEFTNLKVWTEVLQDSFLDLFDS